MRPSSFLSLENLGAWRFPNLCGAVPAFDHPHEKHVLVLMGLFDSPGPTQAISLTIYTHTPPPFSQSPSNGCAFLSALCSVLPLFSAFGLVSFPQEWEMHPRLQTTAGDFCAEIHKLSICLWMLWVCVVVSLLLVVGVFWVFFLFVLFFKIPKVFLGKKANIWWVSITYHPFLVFSSTP